jgi:hypothetical protein
LWASTPGDYATLSKVHHIPDGTREVAVSGQKLRVTLEGRTGPKVVCLHEESVPAFLKAAIVQYDRQIESELSQRLEQA